MPEHDLIVEPENAGVRLDVFLAQAMIEAPSRTFIQNLIETGQVTVNQQQKKANYKISAGDEIHLTMPEADDAMAGLEPQDIPLNIFYEDKCLLVINKPAGMLVHPTTGCKTGTLVNALLHHCRKLSDTNESNRPGIVHRLDRETSGLIIVAKDNKTHVALGRQFEEHQIKKRYIALVEGKVEFDEGLVDAPLGRHAVHWDKKAVSFEEGSKEARTFYKVRQRFGTAATLVALFPESGRTHQLRVHMRYLGHPILGDDKYGRGPRNAFPRLALHAQAIGFQHPGTKEWVEFQTTPPPEFLHPFSAENSAAGLPKKQK